MKEFEILEEEDVYKGFFTIKKAKVRRDDLTGGKVTVEREMLERGDSVAMLVYEKDTKQLVLTHQFRYPVKKDGGFLEEIAAGAIENGESAKACALRELKEELGYEVSEAQLEEIGKVYSSPGTTSERITIYYVEVWSKDNKYKGGGNKLEQEDIQIVRYPVREIKSIISSTKDSKSVIALQWFLIHKT